MNETKPTILCLCGSTRFGRTFQEFTLRETLAGKIVLGIGCNFKSDDALFAGLNEEERAATKVRLDELHLRKIDMADEVLILDVGGYVGESTRCEAEYARAQDKTMRWLSYEHPDYQEPADPVEGLKRGIAEHEKETGAIAEVVRRYESKLRPWMRPHSYHGFDGRVLALLDEYERIANGHLLGAKNLSNDMVVWLRAMSMMVEAAAEAGTHGQKNAQLRGVVAVIETTLGTLRKQEFDFSKRVWERPDVFRSDYPVRRYAEECYSLRQQVQKLEGQLAKAEGREVEGGDDDDSDPWADE